MLRVASILGWLRLVIADALFPRWSMKPQPIYDAIQGRRAGVIGFTQRIENRYGSRHDAYVAQKDGGWRHVGEFPDWRSAHKAVVESYKHADFLRDDRDSLNVQSAIPPRSA